MRRPEELTFRERIYFPEILAGLVITGGRFWRNLFLNIAHQLGYGLFQFLSGHVAFLSLAG